MKRIFGLFLLVSMSLVFSCTKEADNDEHSTCDWKEETLTVDLNKCGNVTFGNDVLTICLDSVHDSRCPTNANCIWGGTAITDLTFTRKEQSLNFTLAIPPFASHQQEISLSGYTIKLINVYPYPELGITPSPDQVKVKLEIRNY